MRTVYSNTKHPKVVKWSVIAAGIMAVACLVMYVVVDDCSRSRSLLYYGWLAFVYVPFLGGQYLLSRYVIDEEADTLVFSGNKKYPMKISSLSTISYKESRKGRFRSLLIHDKGVGFMDIRTSKENADRITAQLTRINPSIEVKHVNYI